jgi:hypothetical protein
MLSKVDQIQLVQRADIVVAATDSLECQRRINEICVLAQVEAVYPGVWTGSRTGSPAEVGEIIWVPRSRRTPCFQCVISLRHEGAPVSARGGMRVDIRVLASAAVSAVLALLEPDGMRAGFLDETANLILIHSFTPTSTEFEGYFPGGGTEYVEVPFPETPCAVCGRQRPAESTRTARQASPAEQAWPTPEQRMPVTGLAGLFVVALIAGIAALIVVGVSRHNASNARHAAEYAAEGAAVERAVRDGEMECYVALDDGVAPEANEHFSCAGIPLQGEGAYVGSPYMTIISVKGVSYQAASNHNIALYCRTDDFHGANSNSLTGLRDGGDLRIYLSGVAGGKDYQPEPIDCTITADGGANVIRTMRFTMAIDVNRRF